MIVLIPTQSTLRCVGVCLVRASPIARGRVLAHFVIFLFTVMLQLLTQVVLRIWVRHWYHIRHMRATVIGMRTLNALARTCCRRARLLLAMRLAGMPLGIVG